jgi:hypothetical protein
VHGLELATFERVQPDPAVLERLEGDLVEVRQLVAVGVLGPVVRVLLRNEALLTVQLSLMNGPVPTRSSLQLVESSWAWPMIPARALPTEPREVDPRRFVVTVTVNGSTTSTLAMSWNVNTNSSGCCAGRSPVGVEVVLDDHRVESVPSENFTPSRSLIVHTVLSAFGVTDSARYGDLTVLVGSGQRVVDRARPGCR